METFAPELDELVSLVFSTSQLVRRHLSRQEGIPVPFHRLKALHFIHDASPTMKDLADAMGVTPSSATSFIEALVTDGLLARSADESDRRVIRLTLTEQGNAALTEGQRVLRERMKELLAHLDRGEQQSLIHVLKKLTGLYAS